PRATRPRSYGIGVARNTSCGAVPGPCVDDAKPKEGWMPGTTTWKIDPAHSSVEFAVKHMMFTTVRGRFKSFSGSITVDEDEPENSSVEVEIDAASIDTGVEDRDTHLRSADFLDVERYPTISFRSTRVEGALDEEGSRFRVVGELTIRDTAMEVALVAT